ncbi:MAG TPA: hypothetical protein VLG16_01495 [Candidatus Saccharimonadales bacterium]|nr:hypothetical protein [Candidatus Saccharimonadales bacterium]
MKQKAFGDKDRVGTVIALVDWVGDHVPSEADIIGRGLIEGPAETRFEAVTKNGGQVRGVRPLAADGFVPYVAPTGVGSSIRVWGYQVIKNLAEEHFVK